jgi:hypothetical protein
MLEKNSKLMQIATQKSSISTTAGLESAMIDMYVRNEKLRRASRHVSRLLNLPQLADTAYGAQAFDTNTVSFLSFLYFFISGWVTLNNKSRLLMA